MHQPVPAHMIHPISGGAPDEGEVNPYAAFGLDKDGNPVKKTDDAGNQVADNGAVNKALAGKVTALEAELVKLKAGDPTVQQKLGLLDRLSKALTGEEAPSPTLAADKKLWAEFRDVVKGSSSSFSKLLDAIERDPDILEKLQKGQEMSQTLTLSQTNSAAHDAVVNAAKGFFKGATDSELSEIILPFEKSISDLINANPQLRARFLSGEAHVVAKELFERLIKPHASMRLRSKQNAGKSDLPKAPPRGGAGSGASNPDGDGKKTPLIKSVDDKGKRAFDLRTPQGRAAFHKAAINRSLDRNRDDD